MIFPLYHDLVRLRWAMIVAFLWIIFPGTGWGKFALSIGRVRCVTHSCNLSSDRDGHSHVKISYDFVPKCFLNLQYRFPHKRVGGRQLDYLFRSHTPSAKQTQHTNWPLLANLTQIIHYSCPVSLIPQMSKCRYRPKGLEFHEWEDPCFRGPVSA